MSSDVSTQTYPFSLPPLPYAYDALEPYVDQQTMQIHHDKHHQTYVTKLNEALEKQPTLHSKTLTELLRDLDKLPDAVRTAVKNNGGGHLLHDVYWNAMAPAKSGGAKAPGGELEKAITKSFGSFDEFKKKFVDASTKHFASGWVALSANLESRELAIDDLKDHETYVPKGRTGLIILDVWEHAYYLKHQNRRPEFIDAFWNVVNWRYAEEKFG